ncbi:MAG: DUF1028 domain-containing protein [Planctomycetota bacterium]
MRFHHRLAATLLAAATAVTPAQATWSVVLVNSETREVIIASATCLSNFDLQQGLPVVLVGEGAAAAQSFVDTTGTNRELIRDLMAAGVGPKQIVNQLSQTDPGHQTRQYAIADANQNPFAFTGAQVGFARKLVFGTDGPWRYAIAGNVLTGPEVIDQAEAALLALDGDGSEKVMAAMEAARQLGGDGRCSCELFEPTVCGVPPNGGNFDKTAHVGFLIVTRLGDVDGDCSAQTGCASGDYFLDLNVIDDTQGIDPVIQLQGLYAVWRGQRAGQPDHYQSEVATPAQFLVADGKSSTTVDVRLVDIDGVPLTAGGAQLTVQRVDDDGPSTVVGGLTDNGDGTYSFELGALTVPGSDTYEITVDNGFETVLLWPPLEIEVDPFAPLHAGLAAVSVGTGGTVPLTLNGGAPEAPFLVLASASGTEPGVPLGPGTLPLNPDAVTDLSLFDANGVLFQGTFGELDGEGRASAAIVLPGGLGAALVGSRIDLAALLGTAPLSASNPVGFDLIP